MRKSITMTEEQWAQFKRMAANLNYTQSGLIRMMALNLANEQDMYWPEDAKLGNPNFYTDDNPGTRKLKAQPAPESDE